MVMNVKRLKQILEQFDENTYVMFKHTDHTDFTYKIDLDKKDIYLDSPVSDHSEELPDEMYDDDFNYVGPKVLVFDLNLDN